MTVQPATTLLRRINQEHPSFLTVAGCQAFHHEATTRYEEVNQQITLVRSRLAMLKEMACECRQQLQQWYTRPNCSRYKTSCRNGSCGCSYHSLVRLWSLLELQKDQRRLLDAPVHEASSYRLLANGIIGNQLRAIYADKQYVKGFAEIMYLTGDIHKEEWDLIGLYEDNITLHGPPYEIRLTVETYNQTCVICWDETGKRIKS